MTSDEVPRPKIPGKLYFRIGEVTEITGVQPYTLRHWEMEFPTLTPKKNDAGQRLYRRTDIEMVLEIQRLLHLEGYTTAGARRLLSQRAKGGAAGDGPQAGKAPKPAVLPPPPPAPPTKPRATEEPVAPAEPAPPAERVAPVEPVAPAAEPVSPAADDSPGPAAAPATPPPTGPAAAREALALMERNDRLLADLLDPA